MKPRAFVVGAASGMGLAAAQTLSQRGYDLVLADLSLDRLRPEGEALGAQMLALDIADSAAINDAASIVGAIDALVITAGLGPSMAGFARILEVNLRGTAMCIDALSSHVNKGGAIVCLSSMTAHAAPVENRAILALLDTPRRDDLAQALVSLLKDEDVAPGMAYALSKAGVLRLVQRMAAPLGARGVRICSISPGCIDTPMGAIEMGRSATSREALRHAPIARSGTSEEVAKAIAFLVSDDASYITGTDLLVDGGWIGALKAGGKGSQLAAALRKGQDKR